ncbi:hypothetical protein [Streptomyces olivochromogenes]|uniref:Uncharacterized protein n=1 Tax=Streptomyces olivochromogenes TaxID=1963 RepID=A0A250VTE0_STROL|nr:hypothetical protein [Streptomyces olivochromogenes]GAX57240.1 hypothetical protein SO3561_08810 [Streptomyces olivochromogenes]
MSWPDGIAAAVLTAIALLITLHQHKHRSSTAPPKNPQDGEQQ